MDLHWGRANDRLRDVLALQHLDVREGLLEGIAGTLTCVSPDPGLTGALFLGRPVSIRMTSDRGQQHRINAIVCGFVAGQSDGALSCYQLQVCDALSLCERRRNSRVFIGKSLPEILDVVMREWQQCSPAMAHAFDFDLGGLDARRYPVREFTRQVNESDAHFIRRLLRKEGVTVFVRDGGARSAERKPHVDGDDEHPVHTLVFNDTPAAIEMMPAGVLRYHQSNGGAFERDSITLFASRQRLVSGAAMRASWDYKTAQVDQAEHAALLQQGEAGNDLSSQLLVDSVIDIPHLGDSISDHDRIVRDRVLAHELRSSQVDGAGAVRDMRVGHWFELSDHPLYAAAARQQREFVVTSLHHCAWNNLPADIEAHILRLLAASAPSFAGAAQALSLAGTSSDDMRYENQFTCVQRGVALTPSYDPLIDLPAAHTVTGLVVCPEGEEVFCDELGRIHVQLQGLDARHHAHAQGAGTNGRPCDSAPVRVLWGLAGPGYGNHDLPRAGMEVLLSCIAGDPDRLVVVGVLANGRNTPATFSHAGALPGNRYLSGTKTREINGTRCNQLRFDDTPGQISVQLASEHAHTQLNLGYLTQPRVEGEGADRGAGAELRTDASAALRAAQGLLLTTYAREQAGGEQLDRQELVELMADCADLFTALGDYAAGHGGHVTDTGPLRRLKALMEGWRHNTKESDRAFSPGREAIMAFGAQAGAMHLTPQTQVTYAGMNIDQVAGQHLQLMSGQRFSATAGKGLYLFARGNGVQAIAGEGPLLLQAQAGTLNAVAQQGMHLASNENEVLVSAPSIRLVADDGSYIKIGGGITLGTQGDIRLLSASHQWGGPARDGVVRPAFDKLPTDQRIQLHFPSREGETQVAANQKYRVTLDDGRVLEGTSDADGMSDIVKDPAMRILSIDLLGSGV
ncbi:type VI secretion system Vgr family protein [Herbaspirillum robiniae]|nr:type VI secretion system Vgr family protein [Herbaspirillum robiniae]